MLDLTSRLDPVLSVARKSAHEVDSAATFPADAVAALRESGLLGVTLPEEVGGLAVGRPSWSKS